MSYSKQKGYILPIIGLTTFVLIISTGAYFLGKNNQSTSTQQAPSSIIANPPKIVPSPTSTPDPTANWKTYSNTKYGYSLKYPTSVTLREDNTYYHYLEFKKINASQGEFAVFYAAVINSNYVASNPASVNYMSSDIINNLYQLKIDESKKVDSSTFKRITDRSIGGENALALNITATGINQTRYYVKHGEYIYMFVSDNPTENFENFLNSIKFTK